jgi:uncharacterized protein
VQRKKRAVPLVVLDTNILISYLFGGKTITSIIDSLENNAFQPVTSSYIVNEFLETARRPRITKYIDPALADEFISEWISYAVFVHPRHKVVICRDCNDNPIIACALEAGAEYIVTGDKDLLSIKSFQGVTILSPTDFFRQVLQ